MSYAKLADDADDADIPQPIGCALGQYDDADIPQPIGCALGQYDDADIPQPVGSSLDQQEIEIHNDILDPQIETRLAEEIAMGMTTESVNYEPAWVCQVCTLENDFSSKTCNVCGSAQPKQNSITHQDNQSKQNDKWECSVCTLENSGNQLNCIVCNSPGPSDINISDHPNSSTTTENKHEPTSVNGGGDSSTDNNNDKSDDTMWACPVCTFENDISKNFCALCNGKNPKPKQSRPVTATTSWICPACTFLNPSPRSPLCEVCNVANPNARQDKSLKPGPPGPGPAMVPAGGGMLSNLLGGAGQFSMEKFLNEIKTLVIPELEKQLLQLEMPGTEGDVDDGGSLGAISFRIGDISMEEVDIPRTDLEINVIQGGVELISKNISLSLKPFEWHYDKHAFPKISSGGEAVCAVSGGSIKMVMGFGIDPSGGPNLQVKTCNVNIEELDITLSKTKLKFVYQLLLGALKGSIKEQLEQQLEDLAKSAVTDNMQSLLQDLL